MNHSRKKRVEIGVKEILLRSNGAEVYGKQTKSRIKITGSRKKRLETNTLIDESTESQ